MPPTTIALTGLMATPDDFGRLRVALVDEIHDADGSHPRYDNSWRVLRDTVAAVAGGRTYHAEFKHPYTLYDGGRPDDAGLRGEFWAKKSPAAHSIDFLAMVGEEGMINKEVEIEVKLRPYDIVSGGCRRFGVALTVVSLERIGDDHETTAAPSDHN